MIDSPEAKFAVAAVSEAAQLTRRVQSEMVTDALEKGDKSPVTVGDFTAQAVIARRLRDNFPEVALVGEESAADLREAAGAETLQQVTHFVRAVLPHATPDEVLDWIDRGAADGIGPESANGYWTLDPIDGTKGFLRGDQYAVAFALIKDGELQVAALGCPELANGQTPDKGGAGSVLLAAKGQGAWVRSLANPSESWQKLSVSDISDPSQARVLRSVEKGHTNMGQIDYFAEAMGIRAEPVGMDSQAKYAVLAAGGGEMLLRLISPSMPDYVEKIWDQAAGALVISEAGGRVTDLDGKPLDFSHGRTLKKNRGVLATNGALHDAALAALKQVGA